MTMTPPPTAPVKPPAFYSFRVTNWFQWTIEAHHAGFSNADILFVLQTIEVLEPMRRLLEADAKKESPP